VSDLMKRSLSLCRQAQRFRASISNRIRRVLRRDVREWDVIYYIV
jgi:hypothetical protein